MFEYDRVKSTISACVKKVRGQEGVVEDLHIYMRNLRGSAAYWRTANSELVAQIRCEGPLTWFLTLSCNDINWKDMRNALLIADNRPNEDPTSIGLDEAQRLIEIYPVVISRHFQRRLKAFMKYLKANDNVLRGKVKDYWLRIEFQNRGSPQVHMVIWIENAPSFETEQGLKLIDEVISGHYPSEEENSELHNLVKKNQVHRHTHTCHKNKSESCRFGFPRQACDGTKIISQTSDEFIRNAGLLSNEETSLKVPYQSTCHIAMESCRSESSCLTSLQNMLLHCEPHRCNRNACMDSVQKFYRSSNEDISLDSAFCLCKKSQQYSRYDVCMIAQEKLHPTCAQRPPENLNQPTSNGVVYHPLPACHTVAELCKEDNECRLRLELFEQSCAIDSVTKKCAGKTNSCRLSMLGIFGTTLRSACTCQGVDAHQMYECLGWQKLIWLNPCTVESQRDFHLKRLAELGLLTTSTTTTTTTTTTPAPTTTRTTTATTTTTTTTTTPAPVRHFSKAFKPIIRQTEPPIESNYIDETIPETLVQKNNSQPNGINTAVHEEHLAVLLTSETTTQIDTTSTTTTTEPTTTTVPTKYCVVQKPHQNDQYIAEGQSQRILLDDLDCSELCTCSQGAEPLALACHVLCVPLAPCRTALAYYSHAAPAYQAFRGRCLCYSGKFICMRPPPGEYTLPGGVFLLLGYSSTDEALLRPHTNLGVQDAVRSLHHYLQKHINNETSCTLTLFNMTDENVILSARLPLDTKINPLELLRREKEKCTPILDKLAHQINSQQKELTGHPLLSIFKMAEVQVIWPEHNNSNKLNNFYTRSNFIFITIILFIISLLQNSNQLIYLR